MLSELTLCFSFRKIMSTAFSGVTVWQHCGWSKITPCQGLTMERKHCIMKYTWDSKWEGQSSSSIPSLNSWVTLDNYVKLVFFVCKKE